MNILINREIDYINQELTNKLQTSQKVQNFKQWLLENGVIYKNIEFPAAFGSNGLVGMAANEDIPPNTAFIAIPSKLLISISKIRMSEIGEMIEKHPEQFILHVDGEFNIIASYILFEKLKGEKSQYYNLFEVMQESPTLMNWSEDDINKIEEKCILKELQEYRQDTKKIWEDLRLVYQQYPEYYPVGQYNEQMFYWAYEVVCTRCFGWELPSTMQIPMADYLNHSDYGVQYDLINLDIETKPENFTQYYKQKKYIADLSLFSRTDIQQPQSVQKLLQEEPDEIGDYIRNNLNILGNAEQLDVKQLNYEKRDVRRAIAYEINYKKLEQNEKENIWQLPLFESSDEEDNDTEHDEEEEEEDAAENGMLEDNTYIDQEQIKAMRAQIASMDTITQQVVSKWQQQTNSEEQLNQQKINTVQNIIPQQQVTHQIKQYQMDEEEEKQEFQEDDYNYEEQDEFEEEEEDDEQEEQRQEEIGSDVEDEHGNKITETNPEKCKIEQNIIKDINKESKTKNKRKHRTKFQSKDINLIQYTPLTKQNQNKPIEWTWYDDWDENTYFIVYSSPEKGWKKGEQVYLCYGRRTNRFLLLWYGFTLRNNKYDSLPFRFMMTVQKFDIQKLEEVIFDEYITNEEIISGIKWRDRIVYYPELSKEFRIKKSKLCEDIFSFLRVQLLMQYDLEEAQGIFIKQPCQVSFELKVIQAAKKIFEYLLNRYTSSAEEDELKLQNEQLPVKQKYIITMQLEHKIIAKEQIKLLNILEQILIRIQNGNNFRSSYLNKIESIEDNCTHTDIFQNRVKLSKYLTSLFYNMNLSQEQIKLLKNSQKNQKI